MQVDGDDSSARHPGVLHRQVAEAADPEDRDEVGRARTGDLDRLVGGDTGAGQRGGVERVDAVRDADDEVRGIGHDVLGEAAVDAE